VGCAFIDGNGLRPRWTSPDDSRDYSFSQTGILNTREGAQSLSFEHGFVVASQLHAKVVDLVLETLVFVVSMDEPHVTVPHVPDAVRESVDKLLHRRQRIQDPTSNETGVDAAAALKRDESGMKNKRNG